MNSRVIFLDYDGVVNIPMWNDKGTACSYNFPADGKVNHFQAVQWLSEFCSKCHYNIVVTSTWRKKKNYQDCLREGGLRKGVKILGKTIDTYGDQSRGEEIKEYLDSHPEIKYYIIIDDEDDMLPEQSEHFIQTDALVGFTARDYNKCMSVFMKDKGRKGSFGTQKRRALEANDSDCRLAHQAED